MFAVEDDIEGKALAFPRLSQSINTQLAPHFSLHHQPFISNMDRRFFFDHESAIDVINTLEYAIKSGEGITKITGKSGTGKTFITANLLATMATDFFVVKILDPPKDPHSLLTAILDELCLEYPTEGTTQQLLKLLLASLCAFYAKFSTPIVLAIDNAERMSHEALASLMNLNSLETQHRKLLQIILIGSLELDEMLRQPALLSLRQRISFMAELHPLSKHQTIEYVQSRTRVSGNVNGKLFSAEALELIYRKSNGVPRRINLLCHKGMMLAYGEGKSQVQKDHIHYAAKDSNKNNITFKPKRSIWFAIPLFSIASICSTLFVFHYLSP